jgi:hypothetical protein
VRLCVPDYSYAVFVKASPLGLRGQRKLRPALASGIIISTAWPTCKYLLIDYKQTISIERRAGRQ